MVFLVTDDSRTARNLIKTYINELKIGCPFVVEEAESPEKTLELIKVRHVDFLLLDWNLSSKMTGLDLLKEIRKIDKYKQAPIIMVTSESDKYNVVEAMKCGATDFVAKPIDQKSFSEKVLKSVRAYQEQMKSGK